MREYFAERLTAGARFADSMRQLTAIDLKAIVRAYPWPKRGVICDIAGGTDFYCHHLDVVARLGESCWRLQR